MVVVLRVDKEKGYIDLSKRRVSPEDIAKMEDKYNKSQGGALHHAPRQRDQPHERLEELYTQFGWDLYKRFGHAYDAFKLLVRYRHTALHCTDTARHSRPQHSFAALMTVRDRDIRCVRSRAD